MNIVFLDADTLGHDISLDEISTLGNLNLYPHTHKNDIVSRCISASVIITNKVILNAEVLKQLPLLKLICVAATGTNNIDLEYCISNNIIVKNAVNYSTNSVAQQTFTSLLSLIGKINWHDKYVKSGQYCQSVHFTNLDNPYFEVSGKTLGILGMGNIGRKVAEIATVFGCRVIYSSISGSDRPEIYEMVNFEYLLNNSDFVSIHSPLNEKTKNLITANELKLMKPSAILVNMGRGGIVNELDLANALVNNLIAGACIDVYQKEPIDTSNPLLNPEISKKLILTPHIAWASKEARQKLVTIVAENIRSTSLL